MASNMKRPGSDSILKRPASNSILKRAKHVHAEAPDVVSAGDDKGTTPAPARRRVLCREDSGPFLSSWPPVSGTVLLCRRCETKQQDLGRLDQHCRFCGSVNFALMPA